MFSNFNNKLIHGISVGKKVKKSRTVQGSIIRLNDGSNIRIKVLINNINTAEHTDKIENAPFLEQEILCEWKIVC